MLPRWIVAAAAALMGCASAPPVPLKPGEMPKAFAAPLPESGGRSISAGWWKDFGSAELTGLMAAAQSGNLDIEAAAARVAQARAQTGVAASALFPTIGTDAGARRQGASLNAPGSGSSNSVGLAGAASYELDFWGARRNAWSAARHSALAAQYARDVVALTTEAGVANAYFTVLATRQRLTIACNNIAAAKDVLAVTQAKVANGVLSHLELAQQSAQVLGQEAQIPALKEQEREASYALAVLLGRLPEKLEIKAASLDGITAPAVEPGTPLGLLRRRPDVAQAEAELLAAHAGLDAARAALLPSLGLSAGGGWSAAGLASLASPSNLAWNLAASLAQTVFDGGQLSSQRDAAQGRQSELVAAYRKAVLSALADAETGLGSATATAGQERLMAEEAANAAEAFRISELQYREGVVDLLTVLQAQQTLFASQDALVQVKLARLQASIGLFRALGGGWAANKTEPTRNRFMPLPF